MGDYAFHMRVPTDWSVARRVRRMIDAMVLAACGDAQHASAVALAVHELLENAIKYGDGSIELTVVMSQANGRVMRVEVSNATNAERVAQLSAMVETVMRTTKSYAEMMRDALAHASDSARLGLARIHYETGLVLSVHVTGDSGVVTIRAEAPTLQSNPVRSS